VNLFRDAHSSIPFVVSAVFFTISCPALCGLVVFLETALSEKDFPAERYFSSSETPKYTAIFRFTSDVMERVPLARAWLAGVPFVLLFSAKSLKGRMFWRALFESHFVRAGIIALRLLFFGIASILCGVVLGLEFWGKAGISSSPLSTVRASVIMVVISALVPSFITKYYDAICVGCRRFHDTLKDEKYLMGRRLRNYDARV
jgi:hypothetical protein